MRFFAISMLLLLHCTLFAQTNCTLSLSGSVLDEHDQEALAFAEVYIPALHLGTVVDSTGNYRIDGLCPGVYEVVVSHIGCLPVYRKVSLSRSITNFNFYPEHHTTELLAVELNKPVAPKLKQNPANLSTLQPAKVRLLQTGQNVVKPIVRGFSGNRVSVTKQGVDIQDQQWGSDHSLSIMLYPDDKLQANDNNAANFGALTFVPNNPFERKATIFSNAYSNGMGGGVGGHYNFKFSETAAMGIRAQLKKNGDLHTPDYLLANTAGEALNTQVDLAFQHRDWRITGGGGFNLQHLGVLRASHTGNADDFNRALSAEEPLYTRPFSYTIDYPRQYAHHLSIASKAEKSFVTHGKNKAILLNTLTFNYSYQRNTRREFDIRRGGNSSTPALDLLLQTHNAGFNYASEQSEEAKLQLGANQSFGVNTNIPGTGYAPVLPNYNRYETTLSAGYSRKLKKNNQLRLSAITTYHTLYAQFFEGNALEQRRFNFFTVGTSASFAHQTYFANQHELQLGTTFNLTQRAPAANELLVRGVHHGTASIEQGNESLQTETKIGLEQRAALEREQQFSLEVNTYVNYVHHFIYQIPLPTLRQTIRGAFPVFEYTQTNALFGGLELQGNYALTDKLKYRGHLNFIYAQDVTRNAALPLIPPFEWKNELRFEQNLNSFWQDGYISLEHRYIGRQYRYTPTLDLAPPPADYSLFTAAVGISYVKKQRYTFSLKAENLGNKRYRNYLDRFRYFADAPGLNLLFECLINF